MSERGRRLHSFRPSVDYKVEHTFHSREYEKAITQLRTGYSVLNSYKSKCGLVETGDCLCGEEETESHYLLHCPLYENEKGETPSQIIL